MARQLTRFDPFSEIEALGRRLLDSGNWIPGGQGRMPTTDVYTEEGDTALVIEAHLPNFDEQDISVEMDKGVLVIRGEHREREEDSKKRYVMRESSTTLYRSIALPENAQEDAITADFRNGVLTVRVPFAEPAAPKRISIGSGSTKNGSGSTKKK